MLKKRSTKAMTFFFYEDQLEAIKRIGEETGLKQAEIVRQFMDDALKRYQQVASKDE